MGVLMEPKMSGFRKWAEIHEPTNSTRLAPKRKRVVSPQRGGVSRVSPRAKAADETALILRRSRGRRWHTKSSTEHCGS